MLPRMLCFVCFHCHTQLKSQDALIFAKLFANEIDRLFRTTTYSMNIYHPLPGVLNSSTAVCIRKNSSNMLTNPTGRFSPTVEDSTKSHILNYARYSSPLFHMSLVPPNMALKPFFSKSRKSWKFSFQDEWSVSYTRTRTPSVDVCLYLIFCETNISLAQRSQNGFFGFDAWAHQTSIIYAFRAPMFLRESGGCFIFAEQRPSVSAPFVPN